ncbi:hypothetical protein Z949_1677 [Sulfitobacter guttiformis KCTC 32187]|nr:hypothetical protein Z949_1677 [Sulfitobacter guttiformis KCTC 32187]
MKSALVFGLSSYSVQKKKRVARMNRAQPLAPPDPLDRSGPMAY